MKEREALKLARDEIAGLNGDPYYSDRFTDVLQKIDAALAQPERHIAYVCPQCYWTLGAQPKQEQIAKVCHDIEQHIGWNPKVNVAELPEGMNLYGAPQPKEPAQEPVALTNDEREALERFNETCEDGEGYDVPKPMMRQLARKGAVYHTSRGIYGITYFGQWLLDRATPPQCKPLTDEEILLGAKALAKRHADSCGLDFDDVWKYYADEHKDDARAVLKAAHGIKE